MPKKTQDTAETEFREYKTPDYPKLEATTPRVLVYLAYGPDYSISMTDKYSTIPNPSIVGPFLATHIEGKGIVLIPARSPNGVPWVQILPVDNENFISFEGEEIVNEYYGFIVKSPAA